MNILPDDAAGDNRDQDGDLPESPPADQPEGTTETPGGGDTTCSTPDRVLNRKRNLENDFHVVSVSRNEGKLWLDPACEATDCLIAESFQLQNSSEEGCRLRASAEPLYLDTSTGPNLDADGGHTRRMVRPGLLRPVVRLLQEAGRRVKLVPPCRQPLPAPDLASVQRHGPVDEDFLDLVQEHDRGLVRCGRDVDPAWLVAQVALAFREESIVVPVATRAEAREMVQKLRRWLPDLGLEESGPAPITTERVVVGTLMALGHTCVRIEWRDILIAPRALAMLSRSADFPINSAWRARVYGMLSVDENCSPYDDAQLWAIFGFQEAVVPAHGRRELLVEPRFEKIAGGPPVPEGADFLTLKRQGLWRHPVRNRRVARLAREIAAEGSSSGPASGRKPRRAAVLVENVEQALALARLLPGWAVAIRDGAMLDDLPPSDRELLAAQCPAAGQRDQLIATAAASTAIVPEGLDVLIRADGGTGLPALPEETLVVDGANRSKLELVDFDDRHHPELRRWSRRRRAAYRERGWYPAGVDPVSDRVHAFLNVRKVSE